MYCKFLNYKRMEVWYFIMVLRHGCFSFFFFVLFHVQGLFYSIKLLMVHEFCTSYKINVIDHKCIS